MYGYDMALAGMTIGDTRLIARGLREGDVAVVQMLVEEYQDRLVRYLVYVLGGGKMSMTWCRRPGCG